MISVAIIQARMGSTRLPGKVMLCLSGKTVLSHVVGRVQRCEALNRVIVATTELAKDKRIVDEASSLGVDVYRGSESDVLDRYYKAAIKFDAEVVVRVTADCPLFDHKVLSQMLATFDRIPLTDFPKVYLSNTRIRTYPRGLDAEIFNLAALELAHKKANQEFEREHVTPYMYQHPDEFLVCDFKGEENLSSYRWTLDTLEDFQFLKAVYSSLYKGGHIFSTGQVLDLLKTQPELCKLNAHVRQKTVE